MTPEDRISIIKFTKLVENCDSKEEILDLCVRALKKYRPEEIRNKTMESDFLTYMNSGWTNEQKRQDTYLVKAVHSLDMRSFQYVAPSEIERLARKEVAYKLASYLDKNDLIKYETFMDVQLNVKNATGTLEVVKS